MSQILDAALVSLKNPELLLAAEESKIQKESDHAAALNAEMAYHKSAEPARPLDSDRSLAKSDTLTSQTSDGVSDDSSQSA